MYERIHNHTRVQKRREGSCNYPDRWIARFRLSPLGFLLQPEHVQTGKKLEPQNLSLQFKVMCLASDLPTSSNITVLHTFDYSPMGNSDTTGQFYWCVLTWS